MKGNDDGAIGLLRSLQIAVAIAFRGLAGIPGKQLAGCPILGASLSLRLGWDRSDLEEIIFFVELTVLFLLSGFRFCPAGNACGRTGQQGHRRNDNGDDKAGHSAEIVEQRLAALAGQKDSATHDIEVEKS